MASRTDVHQAGKYMCVGGVVVALNISVLYVLTEFLHIHYLISAIGAFMVAFMASFFLQKFFTFKDSSTNHLVPQMVHYLCLQLANVFSNTALLYVLVEYAGVWYVYAELCISLALALVTFLIARRFIFRSPVRVTI